MVNFTAGSFLNHPMNAAEKIWGISKLFIIVNTQDEKSAMFYWNRIITSIGENLLANFNANKSSVSLDVVLESLSLSLSSLQKDCLIELLQHDGFEVSILTQETYIALPFFNSF